MNGRLLGGLLMVGHFAGDILMGGGHLLVDTALWGGLVLGLGAFAKRWWGGLRIS